MLKVILLCLILITPTLVLYQNYTVLNANYGKLTDNYDKLTINFFDLEESFQELDVENQQLGNDLNLLIQDYKKSQTLLHQLETQLKEINNQKTTLELEIEVKITEISQLIEEGNTKQSTINSLNNELIIHKNEINQLSALNRLDI